MSAISSYLIAGLLAVAPSQQLTEVPTPKPAFVSSESPKTEEQKFERRGYIPILMFHRVENPPNNRFAITREQFNATLRFLHRSGFVSVSLDDIISDTISIPVGKHPVALTVDDDIQNANFVDVYQEFVQTNPDFRLNATFFINGKDRLFGVRSEKELRELVARYSQLGINFQAHGFAHRRFTKLTPSETREQIELLDTKMRIYGLPPAKFFAYPFGDINENPESLDLLKKRFAACFWIGGKYRDLCEKYYRKDEDPLFDNSKVARIDARNYQRLKRVFWIYLNRGTMYTQH